MFSARLDRGAFACTLSRGNLPPQLYVVAQEWGGPEPPREPTGQIVVFPAPAAGAGKP
jgi:hypothetical protein